MFELARTAQSGAVAAVLGLFDEALVRRSVTNVTCGHSRCRGARDKEAEASGCDNSHDQRSHFKLLGFYSSDAQVNALPYAKFR
jgi:hypothetical protein